MVRGGPRRAAAAALPLLLALQPRHAAATLAPEAGGPPADACSLLAGTFALLVQGALLCIAVLVLVAKRCREQPQRPWRVWFMDTSKQACSALCAHGVGMFVSITLGRLTSADEECGWYMVTYLVDTSLGVSVALTLLRGLEQYASMRDELDQLHDAYHTDGDLRGAVDRLGVDFPERDTRAFCCSGCCRGKRPWMPYKKSGVYVDYNLDPPNDAVHAPALRIWGRQLPAWVCCVLCGRGVCAAFLLMFHSALQYPVSGICSLFDGHPRVFLVTVMIAGPGCLNLIQVWVQDNFLGKLGGGGDNGGPGDGGGHREMGGVDGRDGARLSPQAAPSMGSQPGAPNFTALSGAC